MNKILVPVDFSKPSYWAVQVAADIAKKTSAILVLLHVIEQTIKQSISIKGEVSTGRNWEEKLLNLKMIQNGRENMSDLIDSLALNEIMITPILRLGNPYHGISTVIDEHGVDLVVMAGSGTDRLSQFVVGSNTEKVVRYSKCPVLTVREKPASLQYRNMVYATSLIDAEKALAPVIRRTQEIYGCTLHLVRINTPGNFQSDAIVKSMMDSFASHLNLKNYTLNIFNDITEEQGVVHFAETIKADLVGLATHRRSGFIELLSGSSESPDNSRKPIMTFTTP